MENESILLGVWEDADALEAFYNEIHDDLDTHVNYPGWKRDRYPIRQTAEDGIRNGTLYVLRMKGEIVGSIVLSHQPENAYAQADWGICADYSEIFVIHTLATHPRYRKCGIAEKLLTFARCQGILLGMKVIRLDVSDKNLPAIALYEKLGFQYVTTVDLGLHISGLVWFRLYEMPLPSVREEIIRTLREAFIDENAVRAMWLEGSDGLGLTDAYSDLDIWFDALDGQESWVLDRCEAVLRRLAAPDFIEYTPTHAQIYQRNLHLKDTSPYLLLDICVQSHSRGRKGCTFVRGDLAELPCILFDKEHVIALIDPPPPDTKKILALLEECRSTFSQRSRITKYIRRGLYPEAFIYYQKYAAMPVVTLLRLIHTPRHQDYGLVHISAHMPPESVEQVKKLFQIASFADIEAALSLADALFAEAEKAITSLYS